MKAPVSGLLSELAADARTAVEDLIDDDRWDDFMALSDIEQIQWRYSHADCDDFALVLHEITGWPVMMVSSPSRGPIHRLVQADDGRLLDVQGWTSLEALKVRYKVKRLTIAEVSCPEVFSMVSSDEDRLPILDAMKLMPNAPFSDAAFQANMLAYKASLEKVRRRANMFFVNDDGERATVASFVHAHQETTFSVEIQGDSMVCRLDPIPKTPNESLLRLAEEATDWDYFDGWYLSFDGADPDYAYTLREILELRGEAPVARREGGAIILETQPTLHCSRSPRP